ncbi:MAG: UDP-N-acetylmuramate--L-alanine ligase [Bacteroidota bacterium]
MKFTNKHINDIYFLGIGGIGMSALARYFHLKGVRVSGYDRNKSVVTEGLEKAGMEIFYVMDKAHVQDKDLMVYTPAIAKSSEEYQAAVEQGIPIYKRSQILGMISEDYRCLAVAGTHGKTTTSSMLTHLLLETGKEPTAFLGGIANNLNGNFRFGSSDLLVVEADEFDRSFLTLQPSIAIITSLDADHLDIYGEVETMRAGFRAFADQTKELLVHDSIRDFDWGKEVKSYGIASGDFQASHLRAEGLCMRFDFRSPYGDLKDVKTNFPGEHNVLNMTAAMAMSLEVGVEVEELREAVSTFSGIYRRFQVHHHSDMLTYIDDYAHHPTEIKAAISTGRALFPDRQLLLIFQPHLFTRTRDFMDEFAAALSEADQVLLMEIYPARESAIPGISSSALLDKMSLQKSELVERADVSDRILACIQAPTLVMSLGAGDIDKEVKKIKEKIEKI